MKDTSFFMWIYLFLIFLIFIFAAYPILFLVIGILLGFLGLAYGFDTSLGESFINGASYPFEKWWLMLILNILITTILVIFTDFARKTKTFQLLRKIEKRPKEI